MPVTLNYFDLPGRAEATRLALGMGEVEFEDKRLSFPEFAASPFTALPVLQMDGVDYTQSTALLKYAGKLAGIYPEDPVAAMKADEIVMMGEDCFIVSFPTLFEQDPEKKAAMCKALLEGKLKRMLEALEAKLVANKGSPYFVGDSITIADLQGFALVATFEAGFLSGIPTTVVADLAPSLKKLHGTVSEHPKIYSNAEGATVVIENSVFQSNLASVKGGAIHAVGTETVEVYNSEFQYNEAGIDDDGSGSGGDIYAADGVTLKVQSSNFISSSAEYGGAAIECCGANINDCTFIGAESDGSQSSEHYGGALLVGRPDYGECQHELSVDNTNFSSCVVSSSNGVGGSIAIFDTSAFLKDCVFDGSQGTAVLFQSSSASGNHEISMESVMFYENSLPAAQYANDNVAQGSAFVLENTAAAEGENVSMGTIGNIYCYSNDPYECGVLYDGVEMSFEGDFLCQICDLDSERLYVGVETNLTSDGESRSSSSGSSSSASSSSASSSSGSPSSDNVVIIGLVAGLAAFILLICAVCAMKRFCVKHQTAARGGPHGAAAETGTQPSGRGASAPQDPDAAQHPTSMA